MRRAFTLAETAVSLGIISLLLIFVLNLFPSALVAQKGAEERLQAGSLARSVLEQQLDTPFQQLPVGLRRDLAPVTIEGVLYQIRLEVNQDATVSPKFLRGLRVIVSWQSRGQMRRIQRELWKHRLAHQQPP